MVKLLFIVPLQISVVIGETGSSNDSIQKYQTPCLLMTEDVNGLGIPNDDDFSKNQLLQTKFFFFKKKTVAIANISLYDQSR